MAVLGYLPCDAPLTEYVRQADALLAGWQAGDENAIGVFRQVPVVGVSLANYDDNQHTDNENLRSGHLGNGIATLAALMTYR